MAKRQRIWTRKNLPRQNCRCSNQSRNYASCLEMVDKGRKRGERGTEFRLVHVRHTHTRARARAVHAKVDKLGSPLPYAVSNPRILTEMTGAFSFSTLDKLSPTFQSARYFLHRVIRARKSRILGASWLLTRQLNPRDPLRRAEDEVDSFR